jgi:pyrroloquinoline-quinone synthase
VSPDSALEERLRAIGAERYHHRHPFNLRMHEGRLRREEIRTWVANRYYYQTRIPIKDGLILAKARDPGFRRDWVQRIHDHDGVREGEGGLALWLALADAVGLDRGQVESHADVLPGVRRACDAYVEFVESHDLLESVAASLTELFAGDIMALRIAAFEKHYPWVHTEGLRYFRTRTQQAPADAAFGLEFVKREAVTPEDRDRCAAALERKCEILWSLLDAIDAAHARPVLSPHAMARLDDAEPMLVLAERAVKLGGSGCEIVRACDGTRSSIEVVEALTAAHPDEPGLADDVHDFIEQMVKLQAFELGRP